jgi:hypothetical protein
MTVTSTTPALPAGEVAVIEVALFTVNDVAALQPNFTAVAPVRVVPIMLTTVPPPVRPVFGLTLDTVGTGAAGVQVAVTESLFSESTRMPLVRSVETTLYVTFTLPVVGTVVVWRAVKDPL